MRFQELEELGGIESVSRANQAVAFAKMVPLPPVAANPDGRFAVPAAPPPAWRRGAFAELAAKTVAPDGVPSPQLPPPRRGDTEVT